MILLFNPRSRRWRQSRAFGPRVAALPKVFRRKRSVKTRKIPVRPIQESECASLRNAIGIEAFVTPPRRGFFLCEREQTKNKQPVRALVRSDGRLSQVGNNYCRKTILARRLRRGDRSRQRRRRHRSARALTEGRLRRDRGSRLLAPVAEGGDAQQDDDNNPCDNPTGVVASAGLPAGGAIAGQVWIAFELVRI